MPDKRILPTFKFVRLGYIAAGAVVAAALAAWAAGLLPSPYIPAACCLLLLWPLARHVRRRFTLITIAGDKLRYETGMMARSTRSIQLSKIQDVRVDQTLGQRMFGVGSISIETAGETSRLTMHNVDRPQEVADSIMDASHAAAAGAGQGA